MTDVPPTPPPGSYPPPGAYQPPPTTPAKKKHRKWPWIVLAVIVIIVIGAAVNAGKKPADTTAAAPATTTTTSADASASSSPSTSSAESTTTATTPTTTKPPAPASTTPPTTPSVIPAENYTGTGDDVVTIDKPVGEPAILTFACAGCSSNVVVKTDSDLLVNTIGAYTGAHLIDPQTTDHTTTLEITADSDWTVDIADISTAPTATSGTGDSVTWVTTGTKAAVTHDGTSNFVVKAYGTQSDLLVNEIGSYTGTVRIHTPALVNITADGNWTLTPS